MVRGDFATALKKGLQTIQVARGRGRRDHRHDRSCSRGEDFSVDEAVPPRRHDHCPVRLQGATAVAKMMSTLLACPLIREKVHQQTLDAGRSVFNVFKLALIREGVCCLCRGVMATSCRAIVWNSAMKMLKYSLTPQSASTPPSSLKSIIELPSMQWMIRESCPGPHRRTAS